MGTTLSNGVYLPDEGERNCYAGLKVNWEILNQKVADIVALQLAIAGALHREIVASLPTTDIDPNTIYMILSGTSATENVYNEYMYVNNAWELIGTSATDLTNYYTKAEVDGKLLLKANASDLTSHTGDTTIHVTAGDKSKWNTVALIKQLRLVNAQVGSATTIAFANIDDTNGIKVGDKCMDLDAKMFEITAVDTANQTVTVGSALIDLALDANVVHTSGNETVAGVKTIIDSSLDFKSTSAEYGVSAGDSSVIFRDKNNLQTFKIYSRVFYAGVDNNLISFFITQKVDNTYYNSNGIQLFTNTNNKNVVLRPILANNNADGLSVSLGDSNRRWQSVYATNYYYGSNNVEFSTKFVTTDTDQSVSGQKVFDDINTISSSSEIGVSGGSNSFKVLDKNKKTILRLDGGTYSSGMAYSYWLVNNGSDVFNGVTFYQSSANSAQLRPYASTLSVQLGSSSRPFSDCYTSKINGVEPSSLSLPDLSNGIDISSYIDVSQVSTNHYTPPANGWISISVISSSRDSIQIESSSGLSSGAYACTNPNNTSEYIASIIVPCVKNDTVTIYFRASPNTSTIKYAKFFPCQGNV